MRARRKSHIRRDDTTAECAAAVARVAHCRADLHACFTIARGEPSEVGPGEVATAFAFPAAPWRLWLQVRSVRPASTTRRHAIETMTSKPDATHLRDLARLRRVRDRIDREYAKPLDVDALARGVHMSAGHLSREFRRAYGESPYSYLMTRRIERAMALLRRGDLSVTEVCFTVGCSSLGTFSTRFTELVGVPPSVYRRDAAESARGIPSCVARQVTRPVRNREAPETESDLA
jgi:AraC-like DNA-binding protein